MKEFYLNETGIKSAIRLMMEDTEYSQFQEIAKTFKMKKSTLQSALDNNSLRVRDLLRIAELLGYNVKIERMESK